MIYKRIIANDLQEDVGNGWCRHGLLNPRNPWSDGPKYITMCAVQPGANFTHDLRFSTEEGTLWYHAHSDWTRWMLHGAVVVYPKIGATYPFPPPDKEYVAVLGEWWTINVMEMFLGRVRDGGEFNNSDAYTINGQPGDIYSCSEAGKKQMQRLDPTSNMTRLVLLYVYTSLGTNRFLVEQGKTYLFRLVNAAMTTSLFVAVANHSLTVVGRDGSYLKPFDNELVVLSPGQTVDFLLHANQTKGLYYMADNTTTAIATTLPRPHPQLQISQPDGAAYEFVSKERSLASADHPVDVPTEIDTRLLYTMSMNLGLCPNSSCKNLEGTRYAASLNNVSFVSPSADILEAYYQSLNDIYTTDFPSFPPYLFNFTSETYSNELVYSDAGTKVKVLNYNQTVELVFQATSLLRSDAHPMHLHGYDFYVVGRGFGNFDPEKDPLNYNLVDPPLENTIAVPYLGWAAVRFRANNPGVWLLHCHLERHYTWGMVTVFIVKDGPTNETSMLPPPSYMPKCLDPDVIEKPGHFGTMKPSDRSLEDTGAFN
ncbi:Laccase-14 [Nymphaea thermarum]|nr:Laccase-14 [Nymphaea thermarum]